MVTAPLTVGVFPVTPVCLIHNANTRHVRIYFVGEQKAVPPLGLEGGKAMGKGQREGNPQDLPLRMNLMP